MKYLELSNNHPTIIILSYEVDFKEGIGLLPNNKICEIDLLNGYRSRSYSYALIKVEDEVYYPRLKSQGNYTVDNIWETYQTDD